ncbi:hypothetical protein [Amycolatopsis sp. NPDC051071]|uniref:hypothetical protein n=1 Tax=Amycolatopsis sp. NPDC051071 TaxID=3154637 RepID=UPI00342C9A71
MTTDNSQEPTRDEVRKILRGLISGEVSPREASDWATPWITEEAGDVEDEVVWDTLDWLSGADTETDPGVYLYGQDDFRHWLSDFESKAGA